MRKMSTKKEQPLVSKVIYKKDLKKSIESAISLIGGIEKFIQKSDTVLLKPNYNTAEHFPGSRDPAFIKAIIELHYDAGAGKVIVGERAAYIDTWKV